MRFVVERQRHRRQVALPHPQHQVGAPVAVEQFVQADPVGQGPDRRDPPARPAFGDPPDQVAHPFAAEVVGVGPSVQAGQRDLRRVLVGQQRPPRHVPGQLLGFLPSDLGVERVTEPELQPPPEQRLEFGADLGTRRSRQHGVHPQGGTARGDVDDGVVGVLQVLAHRRPAVDQQEHVGEDAAGHRALGACSAQRRRRVQPEPAEEPLAFVEQAAHVRQDPPHPLRVGASGDPRHVRQFFQRG